MKNATIIQRGMEKRSVDCKSGCKSLIDSWLLPPPCVLRRMKQGKHNNIFGIISIF